MELTPLKDEEQAFEKPRNDKIVIKPRVGAGKLNVRMGIKNTALPSISFGKRIESHNNLLNNPMLQPVK